MVEDGWRQRKAREGKQDVRVELNELECLQEQPRKFCADVFTVKLWKWVCMFAGFTDCVL